MISEAKLIEIFCSIDDFAQVFTKEFESRLIGKHKLRNKPSKLTLSEIMTIQVIFHISGVRTFKKFYSDYVCKHLSNYFPNLVSYNRMVELCSDSLIPLAVYSKMKATNNCNGISFIDSTPLRVCHNRRIHNHKVFDGIAARGHCSMGWFYGFKIHLIVNDVGQIVDFMLTPGNVNDRAPLKIKSFIKKLWGKLFGDKGYIGKTLFENLFYNGIHLVTKLKKNMKTSTVTPIMDAIMLRKRAVCGSIIDQMKK